MQGITDSVQRRLDVKGRKLVLARNLFRSILGIVLAAAATWLADKIADRVFGPEFEEDEEAA